MTTTIVRPLPDNLILTAGAHTPDGQMCALEAVAWIAGEAWSDHPACASPVIAAFVRTWNDTPEPHGAAIRALLLAYVPRLVGSVGSVAIEHTRAWLAVDWLIRVYTPAWLDIVPSLAAHGRALADLPSQVTTEALRDSARIRDAARAAAGAAARDAAWAAAGAAAGAAARDAAWAAAWDAARDAAWDAAGDAVGDAAWAAAWAAVGDAAWAAARDAAWAAAWAAAGAAAGAAAWAAAGDALAPTVELLQGRAFGLLDAMLAAGAS